MREDVDSLRIFQQLLTKDSFSQRRGRGKKPRKTRLIETGEGHGGQFGEWPLFSNEEWKLASRGNGFWAGAYVPLPCFFQGVSMYVPWFSDWEWDCQKPYVRTAI